MRMRVCAALTVAACRLVSANQEQLSKMTSDYSQVQDRLRKKEAEYERAITPAPAMDQRAIPARPKTPREQETGLVVMLSAQIEDLEMELESANRTIEELRGPSPVLDAADEASVSAPSDAVQGVETATKAGDGNVLA